MIYGSRMLSFVLAGGFALVSTIIFSLADPIAFGRLAIAFVVIFVIAFFAFYWVFEYLIFRELKRLAGLIERLGTGNAAADADKERRLIEPVQSIVNGIQTHVDLKQQEIEKLKKREAFRKEFIADISHELKTPLFAAQGFVHTLLDGAVKDHAVRKKFLKKAAKSLDGLDMLVQDLLTLSQIETGQIKMKFKEIDLYTLTEDVFEQFRDNKKEITLRIQGPVRKVIVFADGRRIAQVMTNFISNAIKHSEELTEVVVSFAMRKETVITRVSDTGEGIPPEHIGRIFERFYRVDKSRSREKGGTGLGLAIVKHILEGHNSKPEVESAPGKGSVFSFKLPRPKPDVDVNGGTVSEKN